jgi:hypothetical protein
MSKYSIELTRTDSHLEADGSTGTSPPGDAVEQARHALRAALETAGIDRAALVSGAREREAKRAADAQTLAAAASALASFREADVLASADAALSEHLEDQAVRLAALDAAILTGEARTLLEAKAVDLGAMLRDGVPPVEYLPGRFARRLVYKVGVTAFSGHPKHGKTTLVSRLAIDAMREGVHVVYLDHENGAEETARRFHALGAEPELLSEHLTYLPFPGAPDWDALGALWDHYPGAVGVWDSTRGILRSLGLDEDKAPQVSQFLDPLAEFTLTRGIASLLLDHVAKAANESTGYGRGSGDKLAAVQGAWYVHRVREFSETQKGELELVRWAARSGHLAARHRFAVGDGEGRLTFDWLSADESPEGRVERAIIGFLKGKQPDSCSLRDVEAGVEGTAATVREAVKRLAGDDQRPVRAVEGPGGHTRYAFAPELDKEPYEGIEF